jgi:bacterioferritin-associated ferredoxin
VVVCSCSAVNDRTIRAEIASGALDADDVADRCGAGARCGSCRTVVEQIVQDAMAETLVGTLRVGERTLAA